MSTWLKEKRQDIAIKMVLFFVSPFLAFLYSLRRIKTKSSYFVFFLAAIFFGMSFTVSSGKDVVTGGFDGQFYRADFEDYKYRTLGEFTDGFLGFISFDEGKKDYYFDTVAFYISRVTDNYHIMFMFFAIIFSYFSLKSLKFLTAEKNFDASIVSYILVYLFLFNQIFNINGVRFWTAAWIAVYSIFQIHKNANKKYVLLALLTPYIHGSYWIFLGVLLIAQLFKKFEKIWIILFFASFLISSIAVELAQYLQAYLPTFLSKSVDAYTSVENLEKSWSGFGWISIVFKKITLLYLTVIIILFIKNSEEIKKNLKTKNLYLFLLVWMTIFNFLLVIPSVGSRFIPLMYPVIAYIWLVIFKNYKYNLVIGFLPIVFFWSIQEQIFYYIQVLEPGFYLSSPFYLLYKYII